MAIPMATPMAIPMAMLIAISMAIPVLGSRVLGPLVLCLSIFDERYTSVTCYASSYAVLLILWSTPL